MNFAFIDNTAHRPYPLPSSKWIMRQNWRNVLFLHWPVELRSLRLFIPSALEIDTFDGVAWLGVVLLETVGTYARGLPFVSIAPTFQGVNVRTYVRYKNKPGLYFLSLDANHWSTYTVARKWFRLPYYPAQITIEEKERGFDFQSTRKGTRVSFEGSHTPIRGSKTTEKGTLEHWLTERYCQYSTMNDRDMYSSEILHAPWSLQPVNVEIRKNTLFLPYHLNFLNLDPISHFSTGVDALMWNIKKV